MMTMTVTLAHNQVKRRGGSLYTKTCSAPLQLCPCSFAYLLAAECRFWLWPWRQLHLLQLVSSRRRIVVRSCLSCSSSLCLWALLLVIIALASIRVSRASAGSVQPLRPHYFSLVARLSFFFCLDLTLASYEGSTGAVPITTLLALLALWFGISVPLVFLGAYLGFRKEPLEFPAKFSNIPRLVPTAPWYLSTTFTVVIGGVLPFGACFVELFFILSSMWMDQYYYVFGFLVLLYFQLCAEDYHWWWRSFLTSGSTALYVLLYSCVYFGRLAADEWFTYVLYFGYMILISLGLFALTGACGFFACLWFTKKIYASIKVD